MLTIRLGTPPIYFTHFSHVMAKAKSTGGSGKSTGKEAASAASDVMQDGRTGEKSKTAAASALSQKESGKGKSKGK